MFDMLQRQLCATACAARSLSTTPSAVSFLHSISNQVQKQKNGSPSSSVNPSAMAAQPSVSEALATKKYYVTTPIFYVNGAPHIGHAYTAVLADAIARFRRLTGRRVHFVTGTDEHGAKVEEAAKKAGAVDTKSHCDNVSQCFQKLFNALHISYDDYIRTTETRHAAAVHFLWQRLQQKGFIYLGEHEGYYCKADETFVPESQLITKEIDGKTVKVTDAGHAVEWISEKNYKFKLAQMNPFLQEVLSQDGFVVPAQRAEDIRQQLKTEQHDLSVSRSSARSKWGIAVKDDSSQVVYVWLDALTNYLTAAGFPNPMQTMRLHAWPADVHVIGKDIARFHTVFWPAFLAAADLPLPRQVLIHGHFTVDRVKMSKSLGNVVDPSPLINKFGACALRYFVLSEARPEADVDFSLETFGSRRQSNLADTLGNLLSRATNKKMLPQGVLPVPTVFDFASDSALIELLSSAPKRCFEEYDQHNMRRASEVVFEVLYAANKYVQDTQPWTLSGNVPRRDTILYLTLEALRMCAIMLQPIIPASSATLLDRIGVPADRRRWSDLQLPLTLDSQSVVMHAQISQNVGFVPGVTVIQTDGAVLFPKLEEKKEESKEVKAEMVQKLKADKAAQRAAQKEKSMRGQLERQQKEKTL